MLPGWGGEGAVLCQALQAHRLFQEQLTGHLSVIVSNGMLATSDFKASDTTSKPSVLTVPEHLNPVANQLRVADLQRDI
jgi:hypothetical protein